MDKLNKVLIDWENTDNTENNRILNTDIIHKKLIPTSTMSKLAELGNNLIGDGDMLMLFSIFRINNNFRNYAWFKDEHIYCYTPMRSGVNFLSSEAIDCIDWIEIKGGNAGEESIHIKYLGFSNDPDEQDNVYFEATTSSGDKIKWYINRGAYQSIEKLWFPCLFDFEKFYSTPFIKKLPGKHNICVFPIKLFNNLYNVCNSLNDEVAYGYYNMTNFVPGINAKNDAVAVIIKFKKPFWNFISSSQKTVKGLGSYWQGPRALYFGKSIKNIPAEAFKNWDTLTNIACSHAFSSIGANAFEKCYMSILDFGLTKLAAFSEGALSGISAHWQGGNNFYIFNDDIYNGLTTYSTVKDVRKHLFNRQRPKKIICCNSHGDVSPMVI